MKNLQEYEIIWNLWEVLSKEQKEVWSQTKFLQTDEFRIYQNRKKNDYNILKGGGNDWEYSKGLN
jgi:hypothetical protein